MTNLKQRISPFTLAAATFLLGFSLAGSGQVLGPERLVRSGPITVDLTAEEIEGIVFMREEEKLARDTYTVLYEEWHEAVFDNIALAEQQHMDAVEKLLIKFKIPDPVSDEQDIGTFVNEDLQALFDQLVVRGKISLMEALSVGALIEEVDMVDIQELIDLTDNADVTATFESLICGSRNHLRAFVGQIERRGVIYLPQVLSLEALEAIVDQPVERDCGKNRRR